ncbi:MAG TPA: trehalose-phosphatase [Solirubrobacteraceae bacterium]|nr:trehalose-phosphatase [Solirubrobacteraceae bacterium]
MPDAATLAESLEPLRTDPAHAAVLLDIDGTLAPIVRHASDAAVPESTRGLLIDVARRYATVACVSGRAATDARALVAIGSISYVGNHGCELLAAGTVDVVLDPEVAPWIARVREFADRANSPALRRLRIRTEDKGPIVAFHWRGVPDEDAAAAALREVEVDAREAGLEIHWGRKVLEIRPPIEIDKGRGITGLLRGGDAVCGVYVGDDETDVDAFRGLRAALPGGAVCIGVSSDETPAALERDADLMVDGPRGVRRVLQGLL